MTILQPPTPEEPPMTPDELAAAYAHAALPIDNPNIDPREAERARLEARNLQIMQRMEAHGTPINPFSALQARLNLFIAYALDPDQQLDFNLLFERNANAQLELLHVEAERQARLAALTASNGHAPKMPNNGHRRR